ncbi:hypothetical protein [Enterococcus casseliflavus]|nr:hypothetical protein [Enterococcus casseliflavus]
MEKVIEKINKEIEEYLASGGKEDKACAEGLRIAKEIILQELVSNPPK